MVHGAFYARYSFISELRQNLRDLEASFETIQAMAIFCGYMWETQPQIATTQYFLFFIVLVVSRTQEIPVYKDPA